MSVVNVRESQSWFSVLQTGKLAQTAVMAIAPGEASGAKTALTFNVYSPPAY